MACAPCAALLLAADAPTIHALVAEAKANPKTPICLCGKCRQIMGADGRSFGSRRNLRRPYIHGDDGIASWGTGAPSGASPAVDPAITALTASMTAGGQVPNSPAATDSGSSGFGIDPNAILQLALTGINALTNKPATPTWQPLPANFNATPPPVVQPASDEKAWQIALLVLFVITMFVLMHKSK